MARSSYRPYQYSVPVPELSEAIALGAISPKTSETQWHQLSPGMKIEVVRTARKAAEAKRS